jgi:hypothetical protein
MPPESPKAMSEPIQFEMVDDIAVFQPVGAVELSEAVEMVTAAIGSAREQDIRKLLFVGTGLSGFESPGLGSRYFFVHEWAGVAQGLVRVALVLNPELIDRKKFGVLVALNAGFACDVFTTKEEAMAWLQRFK